MLLEQYSCPKCGRNCCIEDAIHLSRRPGSLTEACIIKCPTDGTEFEITARQLDKTSPEEEQKPVEKPEEKEEKSVETPPEKKPEEEEKKESLTASVLQCLNCSHEWLAVPSSNFSSCGKCGCTEFYETGKTADGRLSECLKRIEYGLDPVDAISSFLGE